MAMKRNSLIAFAICISMMLTFTLSSCVKKGDDVESFLQKNPDAYNEVVAGAEENNINVNVTGNVLTFDYDVSNNPDLDEEKAKDPVALAELEKGLEALKPTYAEKCRELEELTGFSGIEIVVNLTYNGEPISSISVTSAD